MGVGEPIAKLPSWYLKKNCEELESYFWLWHYVRMMLLSMCVARAGATFALRWLLVCGDSSYIVLTGALICELLAFGIGISDGWHVS